jgi:FimV-like protein
MRLRRIRTRKGVALPRRLFLLPLPIVVSRQRHIEARLNARDTSMTTRSTPRVVPLALACAWLACALPAGAALAQAAPAPASSAASSLPASAATQYTVKPGQSLADIATEVTQSHDKTVLGRAARAIFDANPSAFMRNDPSLLKLGAVLTIPALDATGAVAKAEPAPAASTTSAAPSGAAASQAAAAGTQPSPASAAKPASAAAAPASSVPAGSAGASAVAKAAPPTTGVASNAAAASAPVTAQHSLPNAAAGGHAWSGAIEPAPAPASAPAATPASAAGASEEAAASAATAPAASVPATTSAPKPAVATSAVAAPAVASSHPKVSSLQQLLTLKNRVLMELQRHGFGKPSAGRPGAPASAPAGAPAGASGFAQAPASGGVVAPAPGKSRAAAAANQPFVPSGGSGLSHNAVPAVAAIVAAIVAALLVVLIALGVSRRRRHAPPPAGPASTGAGAAAPMPGESSDPVAATPVAAPDDPIAAEFLAILARNPTSKRALMGLAAHYAERKNVQGFDEIAQRIYRLSSGRGPNWTHVAAIGRQLDPDNPLFALEGGEPAEDTASPTGEAGVPVAPPPETNPVGVQPEADMSTEAAAPRVPEPSPDLAPATEPTRSSEAAPEPPAEDAQPIHPEAHEPTMLREPETAAAPEGEATLPPEAVAALDGLDIGLPPRVGPAIEIPAHSAHENPGEPLHDAAEEPEQRAAETNAAASGELPPAPEHAQRGEGADRLAPAAPATPESRPAVTGLGAAPVGRLKLSFDLDLPGERSGRHDGEHESEQADIEPVPQFTPEQLARIARNKLDLAAEYISLGDLGGARTLINEVIDSNDAATRDEAHAMLATLAPLS